MLLYSDGFDEAQNNDGEFLGTKTAMDIFASVCIAKPEATSKELSQVILDRIDEFVAGAPQADDITLVAIQR